MPELQKALIGLGILFLAALALWEWRRSRRRHARQAEIVPAPVAEHAERPRRVEPGIEGLVATRGHGRGEHLDVPTIHPVESVPVAAERAVDIPSAARSRVVPATEVHDAPVAEQAMDDTSAREPASQADHDDAAGGTVAASGTAPSPPVAIRWPPPQADRVLTLRVVAAAGAHLAGRPLRIALEGAGFVPGPQTIYHRADSDGAVLLSVANMVRPGTLDPAHVDAQQLRGVSLFSVLPGPLPPERMLEELVAVARMLAHRLDAIVQDEHGAVLDAARVVALRQSLEPAADDPGAGKGA